MKNPPQYEGTIRSGLYGLDSTITELTSTETGDVVQAKITVEADHFPLSSADTGKAKVPRSFGEMLAHLRERVEIADDEVTRLKQLLRQKSYFRVAYFAKLLRTDGLDRKPTLADLIELIDFDAYLRSSIARLTPSIELYVKTTLMDLLLQEKNDPEVYLDFTIYKNNSLKDRLLLQKTLARCASALKDSTRNSKSVKHQVERHGGHIPVWLLFEILTFGQFNMLTGRLEKQYLERWMTSVALDGANRDLVIALTPKILPSLCQTVQFLRNTAAHNTRVLKKVITANPALKRNNPYWAQLDLGTDTVVPDQESHSIFTGLMVMRLFYACMDQSEVTKWESFRQHLVEHSARAECLDVRYHLGFPENWQTLLRI